MANSTTVTYFILGSWVAFGITNLKYYVVIIALLWVAVIVCNIALLVTIIKNRSLHEPMYLFLCSLFANELYRSAAIFPFVMYQLISDTHTVTVPYCYLQMFCIYSYGNTEMLTLAFMAYDRYLAICAPLHYNTRMTSNKVAVYIAVAWLYGAILSMINLALTQRLTLCGNYMNDWKCANFHIIRMSCSRRETRANNIFGLFNLTVSVCVPLLPIAYSYLRLLIICFSSGKETRQKALSTCAPQMTSLLCFAFSGLFLVSLKRVDKRSWPKAVRDFTFVYSCIWMNLLMLLNPILYGMGLSKIRAIFKGLVHCYILDRCRVPGKV